jgi:uncharacterized protein (DUF2252 family)
LPNHPVMKRKEPVPEDFPVNKDFGTSKLWIYQKLRNERYNEGKHMREACPRSSHAKWEVTANRPDPVDLVKESNKGRIVNLVPLRHGRMVKSPFTFYRGAALNMASDLSGTPVTGMYVQACGDAHLCNFGGFATPERNVIFSINDLDETLPAPWEWDLKRLAASFVVACRNNNLSDATAKESALACVRSYRENMFAFSKMKMMELWHYSLGAEMMISKLKDPDLIRQGKKRLAKEKGRSIAEEIFPQLVKGPGETRYIKDQLPSIFHWEKHSPGEVHEAVREAFALYINTLPPGFSFLLSRYELKDAAIKVVGVGSVGTVCWVLLLMTGDGDTLFLQVKQAKQSVLEPYAGKSLFTNDGQRIVNGYRIMQPYSDPFLGWTEGKLGKHYFIRQLRDIKISIKVETFKKPGMMAFADWCGEALALSHARSGDAAMLSGYMGKSDVLDIAISKFAIAYANQNEKDYAAFKRAIDTGKLEASFDE